jgi:hypothetical protein
MLRMEALALGRFVLGRPVEEEFVARYISAHEHLDIEVKEPGGRRQ